MADKLRELILWRHAKSDWGDPSLTDHERPLSERGRRNANKMANWIQQNALTPDLILCSTAKRAQQTLRRFCPDCAIETEHLETLYMADVPTLLRQLAKVPQHFKRVMLIGHNPGMEELIAYLNTEPLSLAADVKLFPTAAVAHFIMPSDWRSLEKGDGRLISLTRPKDI